MTNAPDSNFAEICPPEISGHSNADLISAYRSIAVQAIEQAGLYEDLYEATKAKCEMLVELIRLIDINAQGV